MSVFSRASADQPAADEIRDARVAVARKHWEEIPETRLVARHFGLLIDAETDAVFSRCRGTIFQTGSATLIDERKDLAFFVDSDGWPIALERHAESWSSIAYKRARAAS
jgi:hypothetical protein